MNLLHGGPERKGSCKETDIFLSLKSVHHPTGTEREVAFQAEGTIRASAWKCEIAHDVPTTVHRLVQKRAQFKVEHRNHSDHGHLAFVRRRLLRIPTQGDDDARDLISQKNLSDSSITNESDGS